MKKTHPLGAQGIGNDAEVRVSLFPTFMTPFRGFRLTLLLTTHHRAVCLREV